MSRAFRCGVLSVCVLFPTVVRAGKLPDQFTLGRYMPGDVWFFMQSAHNDERAWVEAKWADVFETLKATGIDRDILAMFDSKIGEDGRAAIDKWADLLKAVSWCDLTAQEFAIGEHFGREVPGPEYVGLMRSKAGTLDGNMEHIVALLKAVAGVSDKVDLTTRRMGGVSVWSLGPANGVESDVPISLEVFRKGDVLGVTTGRGPLEEVIKLMTGGETKPSLVSTPRFKEALSKVKSPEDMVIFFDMRSFLKDMKRMMALAVHDTGTSDDPTGAQVVQAIQKVFELVDVMDYSITSVETEGIRQRTHAVIRLQDSKSRCALACCCVKRKLFKRFDEFVPKDATGFSLTGFIDLEGFYKVIIGFIQNDVPGGPGLIEKWNGVLASVGFDPHRDLFDWWSGEMVSVTMPPAVVTPMGGGDSVLMIRVKNHDLAKEKIDSVLKHVSEIAQQNGQMLMVTPAQVEGDVFQQVTHPMIAMFIRPVVGVHGDWLMLGSSAAAVNKCLAVAAGKSPSIVENPRFKREGLVPSGPVLAASFTDTSRFGEELGGAIAAVGIGGGVAASMMPSNEETAVVKEMLKKLTMTVAKLGPVVAKINFFSSESSITTYDGNTMVRTESVVTYKEPTDKAVKTADAE